MRNSCVCFITDANYLLPTLVAASQALAHAPTNLPVLTLLVGDDPERAALFRPAFDRRGIRLLELPSRVLAGRHIMHARLTLDRLLPAEYDDILYLDSDVQIVSSLAPLLSAPLDDNTILAAPDPMSVIFDLDTRLAADLRSYFGSIGISPERLGLYFNSGVIRARRTAWRDIGAAALALFDNGRGGLRFPDQDVLNIVAADSYRPISVRWNFPAFFLQAKLEREIAPSVLHFMSNPRPWHGPFLPWGRAGSQPYEDAMTNFPELRRQMPSISPQRYVRFMLQQIWKRLFEAPTWRGRHVRERLLAQESRAYV